MRNRTVRLLISVLAAFLAGTSLLKQVAAPTVEYATVAVATRDIDYHEALSSSNVALRRVVASSVPEGALTEIPAGKIAAQKMWAGQILLPGMISAPGQSATTPEHRVMTIPVSLETVGGIRIGDHVDVILVTTDRRTGEAVAKTVVTDLEVVGLLNQNAVRIDTSAKDTSNSKAMVPAVAELLVTLDQAKAISAALEMGTLRLVQYLPNSQPPELAVTTTASDAVAEAASQTAADGAQ